MASGSGGNRRGGKGGSRIGRAGKGRKYKVSNMGDAAGRRYVTKFAKMFEQGRVRADQFAVFK